MKKCEVITDRVSLVVGKGSIVEVDDVQFELARQFLKPVGSKAEKKDVETEVKAVETKEDKQVKKSKKEAE